MNASIALLMIAGAFSAIPSLAKEATAATQPAKNYEMADEEIDRIEDEVESEDGEITQLDKETGPVEDVQTAGQGKSWTW